MGSHVRIAGTVQPLRFDCFYGAFWDRHVEQDAWQAVQRSAQRYISHVTGDTALD